MTSESKKRFSYDYPRPAATADVVLFTTGPKGLRTLLIQRAHEPMKGQWAFPGGFLDPSEPPAAAARRELLEETGVDVGSLYEVGVFGDPGRDPRGWTISAAFYTFVDADKVQPQAADDAQSVAWKSVRRPPKMAFDHRLILKHALNRLELEVYHTSVLRAALGKEFAWPSMNAFLDLIDPKTAPRVRKRRLIENGVIARKTSGKFRFA